jgi:hypothetical protein
MFFWYALVAATAILENLAGMPFTHQWTMRISKAPATIRISEDSPRVQDEVSDAQDILEVMKEGLNARSTVAIDGSEPYNRSRACFYAIISQEGVSAPQAFLRVFAKAMSVAVFAFGTTLFASAQLMSHAITVMVLSLVLFAGVFGRVVAMWMAAEMIKTEPILHAVVKDRRDAASHVQQILSIKGLVVEVSGQIFVNGHCVARQSEWFSTPTYLGLLAKPFDITKRAISTHQMPNTSKYTEHGEHTKTLLTPSATTLNL